MTPRPLGVSVAAAALLLVAAPSARSATCEGPPQCCPAALATKLTRFQTVSLGVVIVGLHNVNEKAGTWDADYYLYEAWEPQEGFTPQTEIVNEAARLSEQYVALELHEGRCIRSRRLRSTLHSALNLRLFPFDRQRLTLEVSDTWFDASEARYGDGPFLLGLDAAARDQLSQWRIEEGPSYSRAKRTFEWEEAVWGKGASAYDGAQFAVRVRRHITFHLTKFFLPLFVIVLVAMSVFWVDPEDLGSQVGIGVTCLLAAIAFQLTQASTLPEVAYLTLADGVYAVCYLAIALAMAESVYSSALTRRGDRPQAVKVDRLCRLVFPAGLVFFLGVSVLISFLQSN